MVDPTKPRDSQTPPDAQETDVAARPQTESSETQSKIEGLETGADAYMSKPFDKDEMLDLFRDCLIETREEGVFVSKVTAG